MSVKVHEAFSIDSFQDRLLWFDDFLGDQLKDEWTLVGTGSAVVVDLQMGGIVRLTTGAITDNSYYIHWGNRTLHVSKRVSMEIRLKVNQVTYLNVFLYLWFGANDHINFNFAENVGGAVNWSIRCKDDAALTSFDTGVAVDTDYHIFRIECHLHGGSHVHFYIDNVETANSPIATNVPDDAGDYLTPLLQITTLEDLAKSMDVDYVVVRQDI